MVDKSLKEDIDLVTYVNMLLNSNYYKNNKDDSKKLLKLDKKEV